MEFQPTLPTSNHVRFRYRSRLNRDTIRSLKNRRDTDSDFKYNGDLNELWNVCDPDGTGCERTIVH